MLDLVQDADLIRRVTKHVYHGSKFTRFRTLTMYEEDDLVQMVYLKLLHNDNYKKYEKYSYKYTKSSFIYHVAKNLAMTYSMDKHNYMEETILDAPSPTSSDHKSWVYSKYLTTEINIDKFDTYVRIANISSHLSNDESAKLFIRYKNKVVPFSINKMFQLFIHLKCKKSELNQYIINKKSNTPVSRMGFHNLWDNMVSTIEKELSC